jgi:hypothetical protein
MTGRLFSTLTKTTALTILFSFIFTNDLTAQTFFDSNAGAVKNFTVEYPALAKYATDLAALARDGKISVNSNFEHEADQLVESLTGDSRQPAMLGETGDDREAGVKPACGAPRQRQGAGRFGRKARLLLSDVEFEAAHGAYRKAGCEIARLMRNDFCLMEKDRSPRICGLDWRRARAPDLTTPIKENIRQIRK